MNKSSDQQSVFWAKPNMLASAVGGTVEKARPIGPPAYEPMRREGNGSPGLASVADVLDVLDQGIVLIRSDMHPCYHNAAATRLLDADSERDVLTQEVRAVTRIALAAQPHAAAEREVGTTAGCYRLSAKLLKQKLVDITSRTVLVTIERAAPAVPSHAFLTRRFGMTEREAAVATLLARGASNASIASELHISKHTARHHTESVLAKLNVHTRAGVARAIVAGIPADEAPVVPERSQRRAWP